MSVAKLAQEILNSESPFYSGGEFDFKFDTGFELQKPDIDTQTVADEVRTVIQDSMDEIKNGLINEITKLKKENAKLEAIVTTVVKCPPFPKKIIRDPTTPSEIIEFASGHPSYISFWRFNEKNGNYNGRIKLHAFLNCVKDLVDGEIKIDMDLSEYYKTAHRNVENKIESWIHEADKEKISLSEYINLNIFY